MNNSDLLIPTNKSERSYLINYSTAEDFLRKVHSYSAGKEIN